MNFSEKRIVVTGATGLIGKELEVPLHNAGFEIYAITVDEKNPNNGIHWLRGNLFDDEFVNRSFAAIKPTHLLNMAWATTGDYLQSDVNYKFLQAGVTLAQAFCNNGGCRAVYAGTCFEYKLKDTPIKECDELEPGKYAYTFCKDALRRLVARYFADHNVSFGYGRIFYAFGRREAKSRLIGMVLDRLSKNQSVEITSGKLRRDYIYAKDIAGAFTKFIDSDVQGCVNVCAGHAISIHDLALSLARLLGKEHLMRFVDSVESQPPLIVGDNGRLVNEVGYVPQWTIAQALNDLLAT